MSSSRQHVTPRAERASKPLATSPFRNPDSPEGSDDDDDDDDGGEANTSLDARFAAAKALMDDLSDVPDDRSPQSMNDAPILQSYPEIDGHRDRRNEDEAPASPSASVSTKSMRNTYSELEVLISELEDEDLSPRTIAEPSLRSATVPDVYAMQEHGYEQEEQGQVDEDEDEDEDEDLSALSFRRPTLPELNAVVQDRPTTYHPGHDLNSTYSPPQVSASPFRSARPSTYPAVPRFDRPPLHNMSSSSHLMSDISGANTPLDEISHNPFGDLPVREDSTHASGSDGMSQPPKIHINSIPNSPAVYGVPSFTSPPPPASSPFNDISQRGESALQSPQKGASPRRPEGSPAKKHGGSPGHRQSRGSPATTPKGRGASKEPDSPEDELDATELPPRRSSLATLSVISETNSGSVRTSAIQSKTSSTQRRSQRVRSGKGGRKGLDGKPALQLNRKPFESTRLKGEIYKPWLEKRDPAQRWARYITIACICLGWVICGIGERA